MNKSFAIVQESSSFDNTKLKIPNKLILKDFFCKNELNYQVNLFMNDYGRIGIVFRYENK